MKRWSNTWTLPENKKTKKAVTMIPSWCSENGPQMFKIRTTGGIENQRKNRDHLDHSIVKIGWNTQKSPGETHWSEKPHKE